MSTDGKAYRGSPVLHSAHYNLKKTKFSLEHIIAITYRLMNRRIGDLSINYHSNKDYKVINHWEALWSVFSEITSNNKNHVISKYFAESRKFTDSITNKNNNNFKNLVSVIQDIIKNERKEKHLGISIKFLNDFWFSLLEGGENKNKFMHMLDPIIKINAIDNICNVLVNLSMSIK